MVAVRHCVRPTVCILLPVRKGRGSRGTWIRDQISLVEFNSISLVWDYYVRLIQRIRPRPNSGGNVIGRFMSWAIVLVTCRRRGMVSTRSGGSAEGVAELSYKHRRAVVTGGKGASLGSD